MGVDITIMSWMLRNLKGKVEAGSCDNRLTNEETDICCVDKEENFT